MYKLDIEASIGESTLKEILAQYAGFLGNNLFADAQKHLDPKIKWLEIERSKIPDSEEQLQNTLFVLSVYLEMLKAFALCWNRIQQRQYSKSWQDLQGALNHLRAVKRFCLNQADLFLHIFEEKLVKLEELYPYKIFASTEFIIKKTLCSICGANFDSLDCNHLSGELYNGRMAHGIAQGVEFKAVALVKNPVDKCCVIVLEDSLPEFPLVSYAAGLLEKKKLTPWMFSGSESRTIKRPIEEFGNIGRNDLCPCDSKMKFKKCCMDKESIIVFHVDILGGDRFIPFNPPKIGRRISVSELGAHTFSPKRRRLGEPLPYKGEIIVTRSGSNFIA